METHRDPSQALSDGPNQVPLDQMPAVLKKLTQLHALTNSPD
jgi:2-dehydro-3-deoxyphosphooctonate aldolase (KDO 8-P synthase)